MFAYVLQNYDVKLEREGVQRPQDIWLEVPADAKLMFKETAMIQLACRRHLHNVDLFLL